MSDLLDEKRIAYLYEVGVRGGIRRAADVLGINPSAVSRQISLLERSLQVPLLERQGRNVSLTEAGHLIAQHYSESVTRRMALAQQLTDLRKLKRGTVRIRMGQGFMEEVTQSVISKFSRNHPEILLDISTGDLSSTLLMLLKGQVDMAVSYSLIGNSSLINKKFYRPGLCVIAHRDHELASRQSVTPQALVHHRLVMMSDNFGLQFQFNEVMLNAGLEFKPSYQCNLVSSALSLCSENLGIAVMAASVLLGRDDHHLVAIPLDHPLAVTTSGYLLRNAEHRLSPAAKIFWDLLTSYLGK